jgi:hypothetical protein
MLLHSLNKSCAQSFDPLDIALEQSHACLSLPQGLVTPAQGQQQVSAQGIHPLAHCHGNLTGLGFRHFG